MCVPCCGRNQCFDPFWKSSAQNEPCWNKRRVDAGGSSAIAVLSRWIGPLDAFSSVGSTSGGICAVGSKSDRKNLLLAPPPARFYFVFTVLKSLMCGSVRGWASVVSDRGLVPARSPRRARRRGKDLMPPHVKSCPRRGCFGLFAPGGRAWRAVVCSSGYGVGEGSDPPFRPLIRPSRLPLSGSRSLSSPALLLLDSTPSFRWFPTLPFG